MAELRRAIASKNRIEKGRLKEQATFDYILADLIGKSIARLYSSSAKLPDIELAYPSVFDSQKLAEEKQAKVDELSALRFKQFANSFNDRFKGVQSVK